MLDMATPAHIAKVLYRSKELKRDLDRTVVGVIVNNAGTVVSLIQLAQHLLNIGTRKYMTMTEIIQFLTKSLIVMLLQTMSIRLQLLQQT